MEKFRMENQKLIERIEKLEARESIRDVLYKYCQAVDRGDIELMKSCYHEDATDDHSFFSGNAFDFADYVLPQLAVLEVSVHSLTNPCIELNGDHANVQTQWSVIHRISGIFGLTDIWHQGRYIDIFQRQNGEWKIKKRVSVMDCERWLKTADLRRLLPKNDPNKVLLGARGSNDPAYQLELLFSKERIIKGVDDLWKPLHLVLKIPISILHWLGAVMKNR